MTHLPRFEDAAAAPGRGPGAPLAGPELEAAEAGMLAAIARLGGALVAFSGGVDSTYVAWAARRALGDRALAVTALSASVPSGTREACVELASTIGIRHELI